MSRVLNILLKTFPNLPQQFWNQLPQNIRSHGESVWCGGWMIRTPATGRVLVRTRVKCLLSINAPHGRNSTNVPCNRSLTFSNVEFHIYFLTKQRLPHPPVSWGTTCIPHKKLIVSFRQGSTTHWSVAQILPARKLCDNILGCDSTRYSYLLPVAFLCDQGFPKTIHPACTLVLFQLAKVQKQF